MLDPESGAAANAMSQALALEKKFDDALHWNARAISLAPTNASFLVTRGNIALDMKNKPAAREAFQAALALDKKNTEAKKGLAKASKK